MNDRDSSPALALDHLRVWLVVVFIPFHAVVLLVLAQYHQRIALQPTLMDLTRFLTLPEKTLIWTVFYPYVYGMPAFFLLAGFFARLIYQRRGLKAFMTNRLKRIGVPFLWCVLWALPIYGLLMRARHDQHAVHQHEVFTALNYLGNTWFLYDLLVFYSVTVLVLGLQRYGACFSGLLQRLDAGLVTVFAKGWHHIMVALIGTLCMVQMPLMGYTPVDMRFNPAVALVFFYGLWYALGWWLWGRQAYIQTFFKRRGGALALSLALYLLYLLGYYALADKHDFFIHYVLAFIYQLSMSLAVFALVAIAWRLNTSRWIRYLSGASYWLYLVQIPVITTLIVLLPPKPYYQEGFIISALTLLVGLLSYHALVRSSWLKHFVGK